MELGERLTIKDENGNPKWRENFTKEQLLKLVAEYEDRVCPFPQYKVGDTVFILIKDYKTGNTDVIDRKIRRVSRRKSDGGVSYSVKMNKYSTTTYYAHQLYKTREDAEAKARIANRAEEVDREIRDAIKDGTFAPKEKYEDDIQEGKYKREAALYLKYSAPRYGNSYNAELKVLSELKPGTDAYEVRARWLLPAVAKANAFIHNWNNFLKAWYPELFEERKETEIELSEEFQKWLKEHKD